MKTDFKRKIASIAIFSILLNIFLPISFNTTYGIVAEPTGQIDNINNTFLSITGAVGLSNLTIGGAYVLMSGSTLVSSGVLIADNSTGSLSLNPSYFTTYGNYTLTLSGTYSTTSSNLSTVSLYVGVVDFENLYVNQVDPALSGSGITTNLSGVTYANVTSFSGLYFEKTGYGKIYFSNSLDLTNSGTITFLQDLPNKLNISDGNINFDPTNSDFANYGAQLYMYFNTGSTFITSISNPNNFVVKSSTGQILDSSGILSNIHGVCGVGDSYCTLVFDTSHFTSFDLKPILTDVSIISDNASGSLAKAGDTITLSFTGSESLTGVTVSFSGNSASNVNGTGNIWTASETISSGNGEISFTINYYDLTGNSGTTVISTTDFSSVIIDTTIPVINSNQIKNITETSVDFEFNFTENNFTGQDGTIVVTLGEVPQGPYSITYSGSIGTSIFDSLNSDTSYSYTLSLTDDAGNNTTSTGVFSTANAITGTGNIIDTGAISLGFTGNLLEGDNYDFSGINLVINSDPNDIDFLTGSLTLSGLNIIVSSGSWNGILIPPNLINPNLTEAATGSEIGSGITVIKTIKTGAEGVSLSASGGYFDVSFIIPGYSSGTTFNLYRSENGNSWSLNSPDLTCTLNSSFICSFRTDHMSYFAPVFDSTPDAFSFTALTNKELSTSYESNTITIAGINTGSTISISSGEYKIGTGSYTSSTGTVNNGDIITIKLTSSNSYSTLNTATLTIGGVSAGFNITTKASSSGGGSSGGGGGISVDYCTSGDTSGSYYDGKCSITDTGTNINSIGGVLKIEGISFTPNKGLSKYISRNSKTNKFSLKIDKLIIQRHKENNIIVIALRDKLIQEIDNYIDVLKSGNKTEIINSKKVLLSISKELLNELNNKTYKSKNNQIIKFSKILDKNIFKKIKNENSITWQYRNQLLELFDNYIQNKNQFTIQERLDIKNKIQEMYSKIQDELKNK